MIYPYEEYKKIFELSDSYPIVYHFTKKNKDTGVVLESSNLLFRHRDEVAEFLRYRVAAQPNECMGDFSIDKSVIMGRWPATISWEESKKNGRILFDDFE